MVMEFLMLMGRVQTLVVDDVRRWSTGEVPLLLLLGARPSLRRHTER